MPSTPAAKVLPVLATAWLLGCFGTSRIPLRTGGTLQASGGVGAPAARTATAALAAPELTRRASRDGYEIFDLRLASSGVNRQRGNLLTARYFKKSHARARGTIVVLPIWGRSNYPPYVTTRAIVGSGEFDVIRVLENDYLFDWDAMRGAQTPEEFLAAFESSAESLAATIDDLGALVRWLASEQGTAQPISIVGFSISAIVGAYVLGTEPAVTGGALVMGGGGLDGIFQNCERRSGRVRDTLLRRFDIDRERFGEMITDTLRPFDPVPVVGGVDPGRVLYVDASADDCIPFENRESLWLALSRPERIQVHATHRMAFLTMTPIRRQWLTRQIHEFLHRTQPLERPPASRAAIAGPS